MAKVKMTIHMDQKEIREAQMADIPDYLIGKIARGHKITKREKDILKSKDKVYVLGHTKYRGKTAIKPQLRDLPR